jgi:hypothetical protein
MFKFSEDSSEHGQVLTEDRNNFLLKQFFPLRGTNGLSTRNLAKGLHDMLPANDVPVDVLPLVLWYLLSILINLLVHVRHVIHNRFYIPVPLVPISSSTAVRRFLASYESSQIPCMLCTPEYNNQ